MTERMAFIGVSTGGSSIMRIFPRWARALDLPTEVLEGVDVPLDAPPELYRAIVDDIRSDPEHRGALVTTHKMALYAAAADLFDELDEFATVCSEVSSIAHRGGRLLGHAKDPITARLALEEFFPVDGFGGERDAVVLGAGGAGTALTWALAERADAPRRIVVTDTSAERLDQLRAVHERRGTPPELLVTAHADDAGQLVADAPAGSLIVNASGLGKDRPGSPLPDDAAFPRSAAVWEFNYRGTLEFLHQARAQQSERELQVTDGWRYFIHGWTKVIGEVFEVPMTPDVVDELSQLAEEFRS